MSRLDSFIRRLEAQRACLARAVELIADLAGPVLELGLGNGRTYDHLREIVPGREIFVFDRKVAAHPECVPDQDHMILGDFRETLDLASGRVAVPAALAHCDYGCGEAATDASLAAIVAPLLAPLMAQGGIIVADQEMRHPGWTQLSLPPGIEPGRYFIHQVGNG